MTAMSYSYYKRCQGTSFILLAVLMCFGCAKDENTEMDLIVGRWSIQEALRNGKPAASLEDVFFEFYENGSIRTNFNMTGDTQEGTFSIDQDLTLKQESGDNPIDYLIQEITDSTLILSTELKNIPFKLLLSRANPQE